MLKQAVPAVQERLNCSSNFKNQRNLQLPVEPDCVDHIIGDLVQPCNCSGHESGSDQAGGRVT